VGCDIHLWIEYREAPDVPWKFQLRSPCTSCNALGKLPSRENLQRRDVQPGAKRKPKWEKCWRCGGEGYTELHTEEDEVDKGEGRVETVSYLAGGKAYCERNYVVFSLLAGVRSYDDLEPLIPPRGVPDDASSEYLALVEQDGDDGHSHSWLTLSDVEAIVFTASDPLETDKDRHHNLVASLRGEFWDGLVAGQLRPLAEKHGSDNVRIVFYFDN
jgi:hypothetical protein